eukprot:TRINITY_DN1873_c0_g1_i4.p1 TRINITY_DN1873_c0_g1~~TRINITY_DN1873_c0_g1_i4.p1  ORF type:complete len:694 (+),score=105.56 TRINITY_DN1873_c0_g1_i4:40-2121(+)
MYLREILLLLNFVILSLSQASLQLPLNTTVLYGETSSSRFGYSVGGGGDVNGDNIGDFVIGAPDANKVYIIFGLSTGVPNITLNSLNGRNGFVISTDNIILLGNSVCINGDMNSDGISDILIGAPAYNSTGCAVLMFGRRSFNASYDFNNLSNSLLFTDPSVVNLGNKVAFSNKLNAAIDGAMMITSSNNVYILYVNGTTSNQTVISLPSSDYGIKINNVQCLDPLISSGDLNNDTYSDIVIGCSKPQNPQLFVLFGNSSWLLNSSSSLDLISLNQTYYLTSIVSYPVQVYAVSLEGDHNGDNINDLVVSTTGIVYIIYGFSQSNLTLVLANLARSEIYTTDANFVSLGGDFNNDGIEDLYICNGTQSSTGGQVWVVLGTPVPFMRALNSLSFISRNDSSLGSSIWTKPYSTDIMSLVMGAPTETRNTGSVYFYRTQSSSFALPTLSPTIQPTLSPTTIQPTLSPTTIRPTLSPTTIRPTLSPTTIRPTPSPTMSPTSQPTISPTLSPTSQPTISPTLSPTSQPTISPTLPPTAVIVISDHLTYNDSVSLDGNSILVLEKNGSISVDGCITLNGSLQINYYLLEQTEDQIGFIIPIEAQCFVGEFDRVNITGLRKCETYSAVQQQKSDQHFMLLFSVQNNCDNLSAGAIAGISIGLLFLVAIVTIIAVWFTTQSARETKQKMIDYVNAEPVKA